jgi:hypothetical protein
LDREPSGKPRNHASISDNQASGEEGRLREMMKKNKAAEVFSFLPGCGSVLKFPLTPKEVENGKCFFHPSSTGFGDSY